MAEYSPEEVERLAQEWVDAVNSGTGPSGGWRLQLLRHRTRRDFSGFAPFPPRPLRAAQDEESREHQRNMDGEELVDANGDWVAYEPEDPSSEGGCDELPVRIRRFVPGCPWALADAVIRRLHRIAPYHGVMWNGVRVEGTYRPTRTELVRDEQSQSPGERGSLGTYTIVQDLLEVTACEDTLAVGSGDSCQASEETVYHWDADTVGGVPVGEACEQGVTWSVRAVQRNEEGTFDYQVVKTVAKTTSWGPVEIECSAQYRTTERGWRNLYGEGTPGSPWEARPCGGEASPVDVPPECDSCGRRTTLQVQKNSDCTYDVVVRTREVVAPVVDEWTQGTACRPETVTSVKNSCEEPAVPVPAPGERVVARVERNDDDTWSSEIRVLAAEDELRYGWTDGPACRPRTVSVAENLRDRPSIPQVAPGETMDVDLRRTEDCLWNLRTSVTAAPPAEDIAWTEGTQCRETESHSLVSQASYSGKVPRPGAGERVSASVSRNPDCTYDIQYKVTKPAPAGTDTWHDGTCAQSTTHVLHTDVAAIVDPGAGGVGRAVSASWTRNEDCTYTGRVSTTTSHGDSAQWTEGTGCRTTEAHAAWSQRSVSIPAAGQGQRVSASVSRNADCTFDYTYKVTNPATAGADSWTDGTCGATTSHQLYSDVAAIAGSGPGGAGTTVSATWTKNEDCTYTGRVSTTTSHGDSAQWTEGTGCRATEAHAAWNQHGISIPAPGKGERVSASVSRNADCTYDVQYRVTKPAEPDTDAQWSDGSCGQRTVHRLYVDVKSIDHGAEQSVGEKGKTVRASWTRNEDCTYSGQTSVTTSEEDVVEWDDGTACGLSTHTTQYINQRAQRAVPAPAPGQTVRGGVRKNADCTYDTTVEVTTANELDTGMITWESVETTPHMKTTRSHGYRAFRNMRAQPRLPAGRHNWTSVVYERNADCTWSGHFAYDDLKEWKTLAGSDDGGIRENDEYEYKVPLKTDAGVSYIEYKAPLITFIGTGNEGTEAYWKTHGSVVLPGGARLGPRTYAKCVKVKYPGEAAFEQLAGSCDGRYVPPPDNPVEA